VTAESVQTSSFPLKKLDPNANILNATYKIQYCPIGLDVLLINPICRNMQEKGQGMKPATYIGHSIPDMNITWAGSTARAFSDINR